MGIEKNRYSIKERGKQNTISLATQFWKEILDNLLMLSTHSLPVKWGRGSDFPALL